MVYNACRHGTVAVNTVLFPRVTRHHVMSPKGEWEPSNRSNMEISWQEHAMDGKKTEKRTVRGTGTFFNVWVESEEKGGLRSLTCATRAEGCLKLAGKKEEKGGKARPEQGRTQKKKQRKGATGGVFVRPSVPQERDVS